VLEDEAPSNLELMNMKVPSLLGGGSKQMVTSPRIATVSFVSCRTSRTVSIFFLVSLSSSIHPVRAEFSLSL